MCVWKSIKIDESKKQEGKKTTHKTTDPVIFVVRIVCILHHFSSRVLCHGANDVVNILFLSSFFFVYTVFSWIVIFDKKKIDTEKMDFLFSFHFYLWEEISFSFIRWWKENVSNKRPSNWLNFFPFLLQKPTTNSKFVEIIKLSNIM